MIVNIVCSLLVWNANAGITVREIVLPDGIIPYSKVRVVSTGSLLGQNVRMGKARNAPLLTIGMANA
jgi:hypothetical protein